VCERSTFTCNEVAYPNFTAIKFNVTEAVRYSKRFSPDEAFARGDNGAWLTAPGKGALFEPAEEWEWRKTALAFAIAMVEAGDL
jgi:hypothetical protein